MKIEHNKKYMTIAVYALLTLVGAMFCFYAFQNMGVFFDWLRKVTGYVQSIINGVVFAFLLNPLLRAMEKRLLPRMCGARIGKLGAWQRRSIALVLTYLVAFTVIGLFIALVMPQVIASVKSIGDNLPVYYKALNGLYYNIAHYLSAVSKDTELEGIVTTVLARTVESLEGLLEGTNEYLSTMLFSLLSATQRITTGILNIFLGLIVSIYLLMDREKLFAQAKKIFYAFFPKRVCDLLLEIAQDCNRILSGFVFGKAIDSLIIGLLCFIGMTVLQLPFPVLISVIIGVTNVIPFFGPFIGAIPSFLIICVQNPVQSLWFLLFIFLLQQFDGNILGPKILGDNIGLSALWVIFSIMLFNGLLGIVGMFIGVPLFAIIYSLIKRFISFLLERKGESTNTRDYDSEKNPLIK